MTIEDSLISETPANTVDQLVGEGKKFKTIDDLARGKQEADNFIQQLKDEMALLKADLNSRARLEDILEQIEEAKSAGTHSIETTTPPSERPTPDNLDQLIEQKLTKREAARTASQNLADAKKALQNYFGENYDEKLEAKAAALKLSMADLTEMAKKSPTALLELLGVSQERKAPVNLPQSSISSEKRMGFTPNVSGKRDWAYYENLRKTNKALYNTPEIQLQLHNDAIAAANRGEDFGI